LQGGKIAVSDFLEKEAFLNLFGEVFGTQKQSELDSSIAQFTEKIEKTAKKLKEICKSKERLEQVNAELTKKLSTTENSIQDNMKVNITYTLCWSNLTCYISLLMTSN
jgi:hypothetical protein